MKSLKDFLKNKHIPGVELSDIRYQCSLVASEIVGVKIKPTQVDYYEGVVSFSIPSILKTEIVLQQKKFITKMKGCGVTVQTVR